MKSRMLLFKQFRARNGFSHTIAGRGPHDAAAIREFLQRVSKNVPNLGAAFDLTNEKRLITKKYNNPLSSPALRPYTHQKVFLR